MEIFVDFGLFEILALAGLAAIARRIYARPYLGLASLALSVVAPAILALLAPDGWLRWVAVACVATSLINASLIVGFLRQPPQPPSTMDCSPRKTLEREELQKRRGVSSD